MITTMPGGGWRGDRPLGEGGAYWTGMILRYGGPVLEQAAKGKGTRLDWVWPGGYTRSPAAVTGPHCAGGNIPPSTMPTSAVAVAPLARVTVCGVAPMRTAALPSCVPVRLVAETPG